MRVTAIVAALVGLGACSGPGTLTAPTELVAIRSYAGTLHVEPFAIVFRGRKNEVAAVRVWEAGYHGSYTAVNQCAGVTVSLQKAAHHESVWNVRPVARAHESCTVRFVGSGGRHGSGDLDVHVMR
jgi:hypothetical protein